jgi:hypothetical protein
MSDVVASCLKTVSVIKNPTLEDYFDCDAETRARAKEFIKTKVAK